MIIDFLYQEHRLQREQFDATLADKEQSIIKMVINLFQGLRSIETFLL